MYGITNFLIKKFVNNHENINDKEVRTAYGILGGVVGIISNLLLFVIKIILGIFTKSIAIITDALNNLSDLGTCAVTLIGVSIAKLPPDKNHPYGHGRAEYISALGISFIIMYAGFEFLKTSFSKILNPKPINFNFYIIIILILTILAKLWMSSFNKKLGDKINSQALKANSLDSLIDVFVTSATIISILIFHFFNLNIDGYVGTIVSLLVIWGGFSVLKETLNPLLGESIDQHTKNVIFEILLSRDKIYSVHDLMVHNYGPSRKIASVHVVVDHDADIFKIHEIIDELEREIFEKLNIECIIHVDPISTKNKHTLDVKNKVLEIIKNIDDKLNIHSFWIKKEDDKYITIFDLEVPHKYEEKHIQNLVNEIKKTLKPLGYECVIDVDRVFD